MCLFHYYERTLTVIYIYPVSESLHNTVLMAFEQET